MNELKLVSAEDLKKRLSDSIRAGFGMLIPEQDWQNMVDKEIEAWFNSEIEWVITSEHTRYGEATTKMAVNMTPFRATVWKECHNQFSAKVAEFFSSEKFKILINQTWTGSFQDNMPEVALSAYLDKKLNELVPVLFKQMFGGMMSKCMEGVKTQVVSELTQR